MLLPDNIHPENTIYYNSSFILKSLKGKKDFDFIDLYKQTIAIRSMSFNTYILCLDWLYLINLVKLESGKINLCS